MYSIEFFYDENDKNRKKRVCAFISKGDLYKTTRSRLSVEHLIKLCEEYGFDVKVPSKITGDPEIINEIIEKHDEYINTLIQKQREEKEKRANKRKKINLFGKTPENAKVKRTPKAGTPKGAIAGLATAAAIFVTGVIGYNISKNNKDKDIDTSSSISSSEEDDSSKYEEYLSDGTRKEKEDSSSKIASTDEQKSFHFTYENRTSNEAIQNARQYEDLFEKYAKRYGLDKNLLMALAAQESNGDHYGTLDTGYAVGIMQVEAAVHVGYVERAYNYETGEYDEVYVTEDLLRNLESNIQIGAMILRQCIDNTNGNIPLALQSYNFGPGNMDTVLTLCSQVEGIDKEDLINDPTNNSWLNYRYVIDVGDPEYVEHVFSYLASGTKLTTRIDESQTTEILLSNDYRISYNR